MDKKLEIKSILMNEAFLDEIKDMVQECFNEIENSNPEDVAIRERAYQRIKAVNSMMTRLQSVADSDKIKDKSWKIL
jgi:DNA primase catalytic subunit|tara:strand:+ start:40 stop:270 length:231 start_codon:yes stop_codon:yes gene_type:complete